MFKSDSLAKMALVLSMIGSCVPAMAGINLPDGGGDGGHINAGCAPHVLESNVDKTDRIVSSFANQNAIGRDSKFAKLVATVRMEKKSEDRFASYVQIAGVDPKNRDQLVQFIGQRTIPAWQVTSVVNKTGLSRDLAKDLIRQLNDGLRGQLQ